MNQHPSTTIYLLCTTSTVDGVVPSLKVSSAPLFHHNVWGGRIEWWVLMIVVWCSCCFHCFDTFVGPFCASMAFKRMCVSCSLLSICAKKKIKTTYCDYLLCVQWPFFSCFYEQLKNNLWLFFFIPLVAKENTKGTFANIYMFLL